VGFESIIPVVEWAKIFCALDRAAIVTGFLHVIIKNTDILRKHGAHRERDAQLNSVSWSPG
jgi:hypothetical protein